MEFAFIAVLVIVLAAAAWQGRRRVRWILLDGNLIPVTLHKASPGGWHFKTFVPPSEGNHVVEYYIVREDTDD